MFKFGDILDINKAENINPVVLAFVGDAVYSLFAREKIVFSSDLKAGGLNKIVGQEVSAKAQAEFVKEILPLLDEVELGVFKRARNAKKGTKAKNASVAEYNASTGFEAVLGFLYITGNLQRLNFILNKGEV